VNLLLDPIGIMQFVVLNATVTPFHRFTFSFVINHHQLAWQETTLIEGLVFVVHSTTTFLSSIHPQKMPRRRAPTALRLHHGPIPAWDAPKLSLPKPPVASLAPKRPLPKVSIGSVRSRSSSRASSPIQLFSNNQEPIKTLEHMLAGPWDRSRGFATAEDYSPITPPQPAACLLSPGLVW